MRKKINKISIALSIALVFLGMMAMGQNNPDATSYPKTIQTWMYPSLTNGYPLTTINQKSEFADGRVIDVLKPQYLILNSSGGLDVQLQTTNLPHAYSQTNVQHIIDNKNPSGTFNSYVTVSGSEDYLTTLLNSSTLRANFVDFIENFLKNNSGNYPLMTNFTGVELDLERPTGHWNSTNYTNYKLLINALGARLKSMSPQRKLIVTLPSGMNYSFFKNNDNVDYLCIMLYDNPDNVLYEYKQANNQNLPPASFDFGGEAPNAWVQQMITEVKDDLMDSPTINDFTQMSSSDKKNINKIIIGMPSYGYHALKVLVPNTTQYTYSFYPNDSKKLTSTFNGYYTATRDPASYEMKFYSSSFPENHPVYYQDAIGMSMKVEDIRARGIRNVSVWSLGGNDWFTKFENVNNAYKLPTATPIATNWTNPSYANNYNLNDATTINQCAHVSKDNIGNNEIVLSGYNFALGTNAVVNGLELVIIGHSNPLSDQNKSTFSVQLFNGTSPSEIKTFDIYSQHDVIKILGGSTDKWNLQNWVPSSINNLTVKIKLIDGASGDINAVFVKVHNTDCPAITADYILAGNETWGIGTTTIKNCNVIVNAGKTLTIKGTAKFGADCKLIINTGGRLLVDGGTLTNACNTAHWSGIHVCGYGSQFLTLQQGIVDLKNNATIENAICGITTYNYDITDDEGGGIIKAYNANFVNNQTAVKMQEFTNFSPNGAMFSDLSYFKLCNFITNDNYLKPNLVPFLAFLDLDAIKGLDVKGCKFLNLSSNIAADYSNAGYGIKGNYIKVNIDNYDYGSSEFRNLKYGIWANSDNGLEGLNVKNALFDNNYHGLFAKNYTKSWFTSNIFNVPLASNQNSPETTSSYGLYLDHCTGYVLEGNSFDKSGINLPIHGLIIHESADPNALNTVYNNNFKNYIVGASMQGNNKGADNITGLKLLCNDFSSNGVDLYIAPTIAGDGISHYHGTTEIASDGSILNRPSGNTFSRKMPNNLGTDFTDIFSPITAANSIFFHHAVTSGNEIWYPFFSPNPVYTANTYNLNNITLTAANTVYTTKDAVCPGKALQTGLPQPYPYQSSQISSIIQGLTAEFNTSKLIYNLWVDNGNTDGLRYDIKISTSWDAFELYNHLLLGSPKLSEEVLIDAIKREDVLTPLMLKLILLANPQVCRYEKAWEALINRVNPLPDVWIDEIKQGLTVFSPIENLEADISYYANERKIYLDLLKQYYLNDTSETGIQQYMSLIENETDMGSRYELVFAKISKNDYEGALTTLATIEPMIDAEKQPEDADRYEKLVYLLPVYINIKNNDLIWNDIPESDRNLLIDFSINDGGVAGSLATSIRIKLDNSFTYIEPIYPLSNKPYKMAKSKKHNNLFNEPELKINPNPADDYIEISYKIKGAINGLTMQITDAMGRKVYEKELTDYESQHIIELKDFAKGSYICTIYNNGKPVQNTKFIKK